MCVLEGSNTFCVQLANLSLIVEKYIAYITCNITLRHMQPHIVEVSGLQWNPSKADTIGTKNFVRYCEVSFAQGLVVDHAPYNRGQL